MSDHKTPMNVYEIYVHETGGIKGFSRSSNDKTSLADRIYMEDDFCYGTIEVIRNGAIFSKAQITETGTQAPIIVIRGLAEIFKEKSADPYISAIEADSFESGDVIVLRTNINYDIHGVFGLPARVEQPETPKLG